VASGPHLPVGELLRVAWRTVGRVCTRVAAEQATRVDRLAGLCRIGVDESAYKKDHHYLTVVVDHDTGRLVWPRPAVTSRP
jgi:transposase